MALFAVYAEAGNFMAATYWRGKCPCKGHLGKLPRAADDALSLGNAERTRSEQTQRLREFSRFSASRMAESAR